MLMDNLTKSYVDLVNSRRQNRVREKVQKVQKRTTSDTSQPKFKRAI